MFAAQLAMRARQSVATKIHNTGRTVVILTRHQSKYAHFVRDRLSKFIWCKHLFNLSTINTLVVDFP